MKHTQMKKTVILKKRARAAAVCILAVLAIFGCKSPLNTGTGEVRIHIPGVTAELNARNADMPEKFNNFLVDISLRDSRGGVHTLQIKPGHSGGSTPHGSSAPQPKVFSGIPSGGAEITVTLTGGSGRYQGTAVVEIPAGGSADAHVSIKKAVISRLLVPESDPDANNMLNRNIWITAFDPDNDNAVFMNTYAEAKIDIHTASLGSFPAGTYPSYTQDSYGRIYAIVPNGVNKYKLQRFAADGTLNSAGARIWDSVSVSDTSKVYYDDGTDSLYVSDNDGRLCKLKSNDTTFAVQQYVEGSDTMNISIIDSAFAVSKGKVFIGSSREPSITTINAQQKKGAWLEYNSEPPNKVLDAIAVGDAAYFIAAYNSVKKLVKVSLAGDKVKTESVADLPKDAVKFAGKKDNNLYIIVDGTKVDTHKKDPRTGGPLLKNVNKIMAVDINTKQVVPGKDIASALFLEAPNSNAVDTPVMLWDRYNDKGALIKPPASGSGWGLGTTASDYTKFHYGTKTVADGQRLTGEFTFDNAGNFYVVTNVGNSGTPRHAVKRVTLMDNTDYMEEYNSPTLSSAISFKDTDNQSIQPTKLAVTMGTSPYWYVATSQGKVYAGDNPQALFEPKKESTTGGAEIKLDIDNLVIAAHADGFITAKLERSSTTTTYDLKVTFYQKLSGGSLYKPLETTRATELKMGDSIADICYYNGAVYVAVRSETIVNAPPSGSTQKTYKGGGALYKFTLTDSTGSYKFEAGTPIWPSTDPDYANYTPFRFVALKPEKIVLAAKKREGHSGNGETYTSLIDETHVLTFDLDGKVITNAPSTNYLSEVLYWKKVSDAPTYEWWSE